MIINSNERHLVESGLDTLLSTILETKTLNSVPSAPEVLSLSKKEILSLRSTVRKLKAELSMYERSQI